MKPEIKMEDGKLKIKASAGVDKDGDGVQSAGVEVVVFVDAKEAFQEMVKGDVPQWVHDILAKKA